LRLAAAKVGKKVKSGKGKAEKIRRKVQKEGKTRKKCDEMRFFCVS
jgi:hypothetical protein